MLKKSHIATKYEISYKILQQKKEKQQDSTSIFKQESHLLDHRHSHLHLEAEELHPCNNNIHQKGRLLPPGEVHQRFRLQASHE